MVKKVVKKTSSNKSFGLTFFLFFLIVGIFQSFKTQELRPSFLFLSVFILVISLGKPQLLEYPNRVWTKFGLILHRIVSPLFLSLLFFLIITPFAFISRLIGAKFLDLKIDPEKNSYWVIKDNSLPETKRMKLQY